MSGSQLYRLLLCRLVRIHLEVNGGQSLKFARIDVMHAPIVKVPSTSSSSEVLLWSAKERKFDSEGFSAKRLYNKLRPLSDEVEFMRASMVERDVNPRPRIPSAP